MTKPYWPLLILLIEVLRDTSEAFSAPQHALYRSREHVLFAIRRESTKKSAATRKPFKATKGQAAPKSDSKIDKPVVPVANQPPKKRPGTKSSPPWQVLSTKEVAKNVDAEQERRRNIKEGRIEENIDEDDGRKVLSKAFLSEADSKLLKWKRFNPDKAIQGQRFVGACLDRRLPPRLGVPEVAFLGRSNVGKSSLLNRLSRNDQARVGKTPGATASVNLYALMDKQNRDLLGFTDLPGFGYAKLSKDVQEAVIEAAENYLDRRSELALGILLVDIRREPSNDDRAVLAALFDMGVPIVVVATKLDKVDSMSEREKLLLAIQDGLGLPEGQPLTVSSVTGEGCRDLWRIILEACETCVAEAKRKYSDITPEQDLDEVDHDPWYDFDDSEDVVYDQGYDWIHGSGSVDYDHEELNEKDESLNHADEESRRGDIAVQPLRETLKTLRKRVKIMQKQGEV
jgi:GTP-binding protein